MMERVFEVINYLTLPMWAALLCTVFFMAADRQRGRLMMLSLSAAVSLNLLLKALFKVPRPWLLHPENAPFSAEGGYALPCLHTQVTAAVLCALLLTSRRRSVRFLCVFWIWLTGTVRILSGVQSLTDVLAGLAAGILCTALICRFVYFGRSALSRRITAGAAAAAGIAAALLFQDGRGLGFALTAITLAGTEKFFLRADSGRTLFGKIYGTVFAAGIFAGLYIFLPFLTEWLITPLWPGQTLTAFLITFLPCLLKLFPVF